MDAALPALAVPLAVAAPRGATAREADGWARFAAELPPPQDPPLISPDGPGPIPAATLAALAPLVRDEPVETARLSQPPEQDEPETPDQHVPMPPMRPSGPGEPAARGGQPGDGAPLPPERPGESAALEPGEPPKLPEGPTLPDIELPVTAHADDPDCRALENTDFALAEQIPPIEGPGVCGGGPLVLLSAVKRKDGGLVKIKPAATLRCGIAREVADFLREDVAPAVQAAGGALTRLDVAGSFQCRGRNGAAGGKMSEHGRANALDIAGFAFEDGRAFGIFAPDMPDALSAAFKSAACERFSTVLGPGSDGFHEDHLHVDLQPRRSKGRLCQWSDPEVARAEEKEREGGKPDPMAEKPDVKPAGAETAGARSADAKPAGVKSEDDAKVRTDAAPRGKERARPAEQKSRDADKDRRTAARRRAAAPDEPLPKRERSP